MSSSITVEQNLPFTNH